MYFPQDSLKLCSHPRKCFFGLLETIEILERSCLWREWQLAANSSKNACRELKMVFVAFGMKEKARHTNNESWHSKIKPRRPSQVLNMSLHKNGVSLTTFTFFSIYTYKQTFPHYLQPNWREYNTKWAGSVSVNMSREPSSNFSRLLRFFSFFFFLTKAFKVVFFNRWDRVQKCTLKSSRCNPS